MKKEKHEKAQKSLRTVILENKLLLEDPRGKDVIYRD